SCAGGTVYAYDYLSGEQKWSLPLIRQNVSISHLSNDHKLIGASDVDEIQLISDDGKAYKNLWFPEGQSGYIRDFAWSKDDSKIAVNIRDSVTSYRIGIFDVESGELNSFDEPLNGVLYMEFNDDGTLYVLEDRRNDYSSLIRNVETNIVSDYVLHAYKDDTETFEFAVKDNSLFDEIAVLSKGEDIIFVFGNHIYLIDTKGNLKNTYNVRGTISKVIFSLDENIYLSCSNGYVGDLYFDDGHSVLIKNFPEAYDDIQTIESSNFVGLNFLVLKDGNIQIFENVYDDSLSYFEEVPFNFSPQEKVIDGDLMMVKADNLICFADLHNKNIISAYMMADNAYYHLLDIYDSKGYVLMCESGKQCSLLVIDARNGELLNTETLNMTDFYEGQGYFSFPLELYESIFYDGFYAYPSAVSVYDHTLYYHDINSLNTIHIYDLKDGQERSIKVDLGSWLLVNNNNYFYPSELLVFDNGNKIYTVAHDFSKDEPLSYRKGLWIDVNDSSVHVLEDIPSSGFYAYGKDDILVYSDENNINIIDTAKDSTTKIPASQKALAFYYHENRLYVLNPDSTLEIYEHNRQIRKVILEGNDISFCPNKLVRFEVHDKELFIYVDTLLYIVNLDSDSSRTLYDFQENVLGAHGDDFVVYAYDGRKKDFMFYLGEYKRYTLDEMIERAYRQLEEFK
ncbi:MAG: hypothetical protein J6S49_01795, partial [Erysipelotrichaceae bacterium]|nr:hypothetical protein [Erysipelotrichaceae bacterium]